MSLETVEGIPWMGKSLIKSPSLAMSICGQGAWQCYRSTKLIVFSASAGINIYSSSKDRMAFKIVIVFFSQLLYYSLTAVLHSGLIFSYPSFGDKYWDCPRLIGDPNRHQSFPYSEFTSKLERSHEASRFFGLDLHMSHSEVIGLALCLEKCSKARRSI